MKEFLRGIASKEKRAQLWVFFIGSTYISCFLGGPCPQSSMLEYIILAMFADLGVTVGERIVKK